MHGQLTSITNMKHAHIRVKTLCKLKIWNLKTLKTTEMQLKRLSNKKKEKTSNILSGKIKRVER